MTAKEVTISFQHSVRVGVAPDATEEQIKDAACKIWNDNELDDMYMTPDDVLAIDCEPVSCTVIANVSPEISNEHELMLDELMDWAEKEDVAPDSMDELVNELKSNEAADINNGGLYGQLDYILETCGDDLKIAKEMLKGIRREINE